MFCGCKMCQTDLCNVAKVHSTFCNKNDITYTKQYEVVEMKYVAYHRVSTKEQNLDRGINEIQNYCDANNIQLYKDKVYTDQQTGKNFERKQYIIMRDEVLEQGDILIITEIDRLGRDKKKSLDELQHFKNNKIRVIVLELPTTQIDISKMDNEMSVMMIETINNMMIELYASMAHAEMIKREKRQREGIETKKARGEWAEYGRPCAMTLNHFEKEYNKAMKQEMSKTQIARIMGINKTTLYRYVKKLEEKNNNE